MAKAGFARTWVVIGRLAVASLVPTALVMAAHPQPTAPTTSAEGLLRHASGEVANCTSQYRARHWLRETLVRDSDLARYGLRLDDGWEQRPVDEPVVILLHGFNSSPKNNDAILNPLRAAGLPCGAFAYPNDHTILSSAQLLSSELCRFRRLYPGRRVALICHSMGGLVARACVENPLYDPGNVRRLILIAPPTHGTLIAHFAIGTDLWEHWLSRTDGGPWRRIRDSVIDGLGEAAVDLCPNSTFLRELNARPLNPHVQYTVLLGTNACFDEAQVAWIRASVREHVAKLPGGERSAASLDAILNDIDELVEGKGDGVVALKRGRLDGVTDTLVLPFGHVSVTGEPRTDTQRIVQHELLTRVQRSSSAADRQSRSVGQW